MAVGDIFFREIANSDRLLAAPYRPTRLNRMEMDGQAEVKVSILIGWNRMEKWESDRLSRPCGLRRASCR
jgi:hypothetical protein